MDSRWMPLFAAAVGDVGGVGGAYIGGVVANEGQEQQSQSERAAAIQDLRRDAYGEFLGTAQELQVAFFAGDYSQAALNAIAVRLYVAKARVDLVTDKAAVKKAAAGVVDKLTNPTPKADQATRKFLAEARDDVEASGK
jgi:hypothetical protein